METIDEKELGSPEGIPNDVLYYMQRAGNWMRFVAIVGFVFTGMMVIFALLIPNIVDSATYGADMPGAFGFGAGLTVVYIVMAVVMFFPNFYLLTSANGFRSYAALQNMNDLETGFRRLSSLFVFTGVLIIIYFVFLVIAIGASLTL